MRNRSKIAPTVDKGGPLALQTQFEALVTQVQHLARAHYECQGCYYQMGPWVQAYGLKIRRRRVLAYCRPCIGKIVRDLTTLIELDAEHMGHPVDRVSEHQSRQHMRRMEDTRG